MNTTRAALFFAISLSAFYANAANIPSDYQGAQQLNQMNCIEEATQTCINNVCLNSSDRNCESNCKSMAGDKCRLQNVN